MLYSLIRLAIKYRYAIAIAGALAGLWGAYAYAKGIGREECQTAYQKALFEAEQKAQFEIRKVRDEYSKKKANIPAQDSGDGVGRITADVLRRLPDGGAR